MLVSIGNDYKNDTNSRFAAFEISLDVWQTTNYLDSVFHPLVTTRKLKVLIAKSLAAQLHTRDRRSLEINPIG